VKLKLLRRTHKDYERDTWERFDDLFRGGPGFRRNIRKYLPRHDLEALPVYKRRLEAAHYLNYSGSIGSYFAALVFGTPPLIKAEPETVDKVYPDFKEDADGKGTDLNTFVSDRFIEAMIKKRGYWRVAMPEPPAPEERARLSRKDFLDRYGRPHLVPLATEQITNWKLDAEGRFIWVVEHQRLEQLEEFGDEQADCDRVLDAVARYRRRALGDLVSRGSAAQRRYGGSDGGPAGHVRADPHRQDRAARYVVADGLSGRAAARALSEVVCAVVVD
jgi:hypothetical protein